MPPAFRPDAAERVTGSAAGTPLKFTRLNDFSGLSALLRNLFRACDRERRRRHFRVRFERVQRFAAPFPSRFLFRSFSWVPEAVLVRFPAKQSCLSSIY